MTNTVRTVPLDGRLCDGAARVRQRDRDRVACRRDGRGDRACHWVRGADDSRRAPLELRPLRGSPRGKRGGCHELLMTFGAVADDGSAAGDAPSVGGDVDLAPTWQYHAVRRASRRRRPLPKGASSGLVSLGGCFYAMRIEREMLLLSAATTIWPNLEPRGLTCLG